MTVPHWVVERGRLPRRRWRVLFVAANNERVVWSEGYSSHAAALHAIDVVRADPDAPIQDRT